MRRGLETGSRQTYTGTKLETAETAKGRLRGTAPVLAPTVGATISISSIFSAVKAVASAWRTQAAASPASMLSWFCPVWTEWSEDHGVATPAGEAAVQRGGAPCARRRAPDRHPSRSSGRRRGFGGGV